MEIAKKLANSHNDIYGAEPVTIVVLGDSVSQGCFELFESGDAIDTVFEHQYAYGTRMDEMLHLLFPRAHIHVVNSGISGDNAQNGLKRLERDVLSFHPDLVVVSYGLNDATRGDAGLDAYTQALEGIFRAVVQTGAECIFMTENMMNTTVSCHIEKERIREMAERTLRVQTEGVLERYFEAAKAVANANGVRVCDCYAKWKAMECSGVDVTNLLANSINHPIRPMHALFAYSLVETMLEM